MRFAVLSSFSLAALLFALASRAPAGSSKYFEPTHRVSGIGVARDDMSEDLLDLRTDLMIQSHTVGSWREPLAVAGAKRLAGPKVQALVKLAADPSGLPASLTEALSFLEI